jgi:hypothetical protein
MHSEGAHAGSEAAPPLGFESRSRGSYFFVIN